ncbi:hypothetical protein [Fulvivirga lutimaris]|uniref:hypothetical protein n=1 Tax=Fulvivirga lutimaris TaxID=1819566 RepID=UPI0012BB9854|nr:hypothetical protein [Fulvivirga lutimaris]MTI39126.1 hypothetical protein [Fulvivirga lutimaris]
MSGEATNNWEVKNSAQMKALSVLIIASMVMALGFITYALLGQPTDTSFFIINGILPVLIIVQFLFLKPSSIAVIKEGDRLKISNHSLFNRKKSKDLDLNIDDVKGFKVLKARSIVGGKLVIEYSKDNTLSSVSLNLRNFTFPRRKKLLKLMSDTFQ